MVGDDGFGRWRGDLSTTGGTLAERCLVCTASDSGFPKMGQLVAPLGGARQRRVAFVAYGSGFPTMGKHEVRRAVFVAGGCVFPTTGGARVALRGLLGPW